MRTPASSGAPVPGRFPLWEALAALAAVALYARTVGFGWVYDDQMEVARNAFVTSLTYLPRVFATTVWAGSGMETFLYRPLAIVTYQINHVVSGSAPWSYHLANVFLHAGAAAMVVRLGAAWGLSRVAAGVAGVVFAVHPIHVEAVAPVFGRKDLLATLFLLGMLLAHRGAVARGGWRAWAAPLLFLAAMLSKEVGVVGVAVVAVQDLFLEQDRRAFLSRRRVPLLYASYLMAAAAYLAARTLVTGGLAIPDTAYFDNPLVSAPAAARLATAWVVVARGVGLLLLPVGQSPDYSFDAIPVVASVADPRLVAALAGTGVVAALLAFRRTRRRPLPLGVVWYALAILPTANLLLVSGTIFAERTLYLPSVAFSLLAGAGAGWLVARHPRAGWGAVGVVLVALSLQAVRYTAAWRDDVTLFRRAVEAVPTSTKAHHKLGEELLRRGELEPALASLHRALEIAPENAWAAETLAVARSHAADRYLAGAREGRLPDGAEILYALGAVALERGERTLAVEAVERAVAADPALARGWLTLALLRRADGDVEGEDDALRRFLETAEGRYPDQEAAVRAQLGARSPR